MRLVLNRDVKVGGVLLKAGADVSKLSKDYLYSIEHQGWASWQADVKQEEPRQSQDHKPQFSKRKK